MKKTIFALLFLLLTLPVFAVPETVLFAGKTAAQSQITVAPWGGGSGTESTEVFLFGGHSLKLTTLDLYQGARVTFNAPVALTPDVAGSVFQITLRRGAPVLHYDPRLLPDAAAATTAAPGGLALPGGMNSSSSMNNPGSMGFPGGYPGQGAFGPNGGGQGAFGPGGFSGGGQGGYPGGGRRRGNRSYGGGRVADAPISIPQVENLRFLFTLADGRQADILRPYPQAADGTLGEGWYSIVVPLSLLKFSGGNAAASQSNVLQSVTVGGDQFGVFYIGRLRLATDTAPLTVSIEGQETAAPDQPITLRAKLDDTLSALKYDWNFDGGTADPATGAVVTPEFATAGHDYTVTLTVTDLDGIKKAAQATKKIHISEEMQQNPGMRDPRMQDPRMQDPRMRDPRMQDPRMQDPRMQDPRMQDPRMQGDSPEQQ